MTATMASNSSNTTSIAPPASSELYLAELLGDRSTLPDSVSDWLEPLRQTAGDRVRVMSLPTQRDEEWRFTNLSNLKATKFGTSDAAIASVDAFVMPETAGHRLTFVNGRYSSELSDLSDVPAGVTVSHLTSLTGEQQEQVRSHFSLDTMGRGDVFALLNAACMQDMAVILVEKNCVVETPLQVLFVSAPGGTPSISHPRCAIVADRNSSVTVVEQFVGIGEQPYFANAVTEIVLAENARVEHCKWQSDADNSFHIATTAIAQAQDSHYTCHAIGTGAKLSRHTLSTEQQGKNVTTILNGLTIACGEQVSDTHTAIDHAKPHGTSEQVHKCIVGDRAHTIFNGKVIVRQDAQKIDSSQSSRNLLLSDSARVDTKPQLEIFADDVKCAHGATVSQLETDEVFYLQSRGLSEEKARQLLTYAFAVESCDRISVKSLADSIREYALNHSSFSR